MGRSDRRFPARYGEVQVRRVKAVKGIIVVAFAALLAGGCAPVYVAPALNAPLLNRAKELHLAGHMGTNGIDFQVAYSVTDSVGVAGALSTDPSGHGDQDPAEDVVDMNHSHLYGEGAVGYYLPFEEKVSFEAFAGMGAGRTRGELIFWRESRDETAESSGIYFRPYFQLDIGVSTSVVDLGIATRGCLVYYDYASHDERIRDGDAVMFFMEPFLFARLGSEAVKLEWQGGFVVPFYGDEDLNMGWTVVHFSFGLHLRLPLEEKKEPVPNATQKR